MTLPLELIGTELIEALLTSNSIVESLGVIEVVRFGLSPCTLNLLLDLFTLEVAEQRLSNRVIRAIYPTTHARSHSLVFAPTVELIAAELTALIRMDDLRLFGPPAAMTGVTP